MNVSSKNLDTLYAKYNRRRFVHPDPLEFVYLYKNTADRELVGLIASSLAYGRVAQILNSTRKVLDILGDAPAAKIMKARPASIQKWFVDFKHRFSTGAELAHLLINTAKMLRNYQTLGSRFALLYSKRDEDIIPALSRFVDELTPGENSHLLPHPARGSACKRLMLFLRWMIRRDAVDLGLWRDVPKSKLIIPLDTHMFRIARILGLTTRKTANLNAAREITNSFKNFAPRDPVKYDFALTRLGIRADASIEEVSKWA